MGYRSEVILAVGHKVMPQFLTTLSRSSEARALCFQEHDDMIKDYCGEKGAMLFRWDSIKWYDSYEGVAALKDFIDWCDGEEIEIDGKITHAAEYYRFVRIGEDMDDNETQGWGFDIHIERSVSY